MRQVLAYILGPIVGTVVYSISVIVNSIIIGDIEPTIPGIFLFTFGNIAAFIVMAKFAKWLSPNRNGSYRVSVFPVSYTHLDVYKRQVLQIIIKLQMMNLIK